MRIARQRAEGLRGAAPSGPSTCRLSPTTSSRGISRSTALPAARRESSTAPTIARRSYAEAWAIVHFLRHSSRENAARVHALVNALAQGTTAHEAVDLVFGGMDLTAMERDLKSYIAAL